MSRIVMHISPAPGRRFTTRWRACFLLLAILTRPALVAADVVTDWNVVVRARRRRASAARNSKSRVEAMVQIAVHDALNAIDPRYERYTASARLPLARRPTPRSPRRHGGRCSSCWRPCRTRR